MRLLITNIIEQKGKEVQFNKSALIRVPIRLGQDAFTVGEISEENIDRMIDAIHAFKLLMKVYKVEKFMACATSAMREAYNGKEVAEIIKKKTDIKIEIIDGKRVKVDKKKIHPKGDSFWTLKYSDNYILWCLVRNHQIDKIWLEDKNKVSNTVYWNKDERLQLVFDYNSLAPLQGKNQIMNLLPKEIKRDFLLDQLFGT